MANSTVVPFMVTCYLEQQCILEGLENKAMTRNPTLNV